MSKPAKAPRSAAVGTSPAATPAQRPARGGVYTEHADGSLRQIEGLPAPQGHPPPSPTIPNGAENEK